ncbi:hypothetical protein RJT34_19692 [Clitoria ternatea]|uniref:Uncharacterized protein n=1 Tax=Clitoria ternatea TaxID=43366 RepID=A0AAN9IRY0_CLITE
MEWNRGHAIGHGSSSSVFIATSRHGSGGGGPFAVKSTEISNSEPLQKERKILSSLSSPYVVEYKVVVLILLKFQLLAGSEGSEEGAIEVEGCDNCGSETASTSNGNELVKSNVSGSISGHVCQGHKCSSRSDSVAVSDLNFDRGIAQSMLFPETLDFL